MAFFSASSVSSGYVLKRLGGVLRPAFRHPGTALGRFRNRCLIASFFGSLSSGDS